MDGKVCILVVDDRRENLVAMEALLEAPDVETISADSGNRALELMLEHDFALVLLDVQMPDMDGFEVAQLMKKNEKTKYIPIIFLTAISKDQDYVYRGYETGAVDYLFKPIDTDILKNKVTVFLQLHRQKMELDNHRKTLTQKVTELQETQQKLLIANEELANLSALDGLTGIANRRRLDTFMENEWRRSLRKGAFFSLIMVDIDYFKSFNDNYGHLAGDECLKRIAAALASSLRRPSDLVARFGGEEFLAVLPETTMQEAKQVVTLLSKAIEILAIPHGYSHVADFITVSQGLASTIPQRNSKPLELLNAADEALYEAKNNGRNTVRCIELLL